MNQPLNNWRQSFPESESQWENQWLREPTESYTENMVSSIPCERMRIPRSEKKYMDDWMGGWYSGESKRISWNSAGYFSWCHTKTTACVGVWVWVFYEVRSPNEKEMTVRSFFYNDTCGIRCMEPLILYYGKVLRPHDSLCFIEICLFEFASVYLFFKKVCCGLDRLNN